MSNLTDTDLLAVEVKALAHFLSCFSGLTHVVQVMKAEHEGDGPWESIAAFNNGVIAEWYARKATESPLRPKFQLYRVIETGMEPHRI